MSQDFIYIILYILFIYLIGFAFLRIFFRKTLIDNNFLINLGLFWAVGNFFLVTFLFILMFFDKLSLFNQKNFHIGLITLIVISLTAVLFSFKDLRKPNIGLLVVFVALLIFFMPLFKDSLFSFAIDWDAVAVVFLKAKSFFLSPGIWNNFFYKDLSRFASTNKAYPVGFSLLIAGYYRLINFVNDQNIQLYFSMFYFNLVLVALGFFVKLLKRIPLIISFFITLSFFIMPIFVNYSHNGYVDLPISFIMTCALVLFSFLMEEKTWSKKFSYFLLIMMISALAAAFKNEGYIFFAVITFVSFLVCTFDLFKNRGFKEIRLVNIFSFIIVTLLSLTAIFIWQYYMKKSSTDFYLDRTGLTKESFTRIKPIFFFYIDEALNTSRYGILLISFILLYVFEVTVLIFNKKINKLLPSLIIFIQLLAYTYVYLVTTVPFMTQLETSFPRLLLQILPSFFILIIYQASNFFSFYDQRPQDTN